MDTILLDLEFYSQIGGETHIHADPEMLYVIKGSAVVKVTGRIWHLKTHDYIVINANQQHTFDVGQDGLIGTFHLPHGMISSFVGHDNFSIAINSASGQADQKNEEIRNLLDEIFSSGTDRKNLFANYSLYYRLLEILTGAYLKVNDKEHSEGDLSTNNRLLEIKEYINQYYRQNISLNDLAARLFLSPSYLSKYFKKHFGANFSQFVNEIRLNHALSDIKFTDKPVTKIALEVGFTNLRTFNKLFVSKHGQTPTVYRRNFRQNVNAATIDDRPLSQFPSPTFALSTHNDHPDSMSRFVQIPAQRHSRLTPFWREIINIGIAEELLLSDMQNHILKLKEKLHFRYVRFWGLFTRNMYLNYHEVGKIYNFNRLDRILDFLVANQIKPMIEIANKNKVLSRSSHDKRKVAPSETNLFYSNDLIEYFFHELAVHLIDRYGQVEVESWMFEFWMEENEKSFDKRIVFDEDIAHHAQLFSLVAGTLRKVIPNISLGTGGFSIRYDRHCTTHIIHALEMAAQKPDVLTFYAFPLAKPAETPIQHNQIISPDYLKEKLLLINKVVEKTSLKNLPILVSEWNLTAYNRNIVNDSVLKGSYIIKNVIDCIGITDGIGYWLGSDIYSDFIEDSRLIIGSSGLLTKDGISKPAWHAFAFLNALGPHLLSKSDHHLATGDGENSWTILCHNHKNLNHYYLVFPEEKVHFHELPRMLIDNKPLHLNLVLNVPDNEIFRVRILSVNRQSGSIHDEWNRMNQPQKLDRDDIAYLTDICVPDIKIIEMRSAEGRLQIDTQLEANEFQLIQIARTA